MNWRRSRLPNLRKQQEVKVRNRNLFVRLGRPPNKQILTPRINASTGERQGLAPTDGLDMAIPASAYKGPGAPRFHDDPKFYGGGKVRR